MAIALGWQMAQMQFGRSGRIVITMHTASSASDEEWATYLEALDRWVKNVDRETVMQTSIVFTDGAAPSADQRRAFVEIMGNYAFRSAIVTTSRLTRGIVTALSWFTPGVKAFAPLDVDGILHHAQIGSYELSTALTMASSFSRTLGGVAVFEAFAAAVAARPVEAVG